MSSGRPTCAALAGAALLALALAGCVGGAWVGGGGDLPTPAQAPVTAETPSATPSQPALPPPATATRAPTLAPPASPAAGTPTGAPRPADRSYRSSWERSTLSGRLPANYPRFVRRPRFTLYYQPDTYTALHLDETVALVEDALARVEGALGVTMPERFEVLVAGTLYERPNAHLRGMSASNVGQVYVLHDGTGTPADNAYFFAHELAHLVAAHAIGSHGDSIMLSEGLATWAARSTLEEGGYLPQADLCAAIDAAGLLPPLAQIEEEREAFKGHIRHPFTYFGAGCFVGYLIDTYGPETFRELYPTSAYTALTGRSLEELDAAWRATLRARQTGIDAARLEASARRVSEAYAFVFYHYDDADPLFHEAYVAADRARVALWMGDLDRADAWVEQVHVILGWGR